MKTQKKPIFDKILFLHKENNKNKFLVLLAFVLFPLQTNAAYIFYNNQTPYTVTGSGYKKCRTDSYYIYQGTWSVNPYQPATFTNLLPDCDYKWTIYTPNLYFSSWDGVSFITPGQYSLPRGRGGIVTFSLPQSCTTPWGSTVADGSSVTSYSTNSVPYGSSCSSYARTSTCNNGSWNITPYSYSSCSTQAPQSCTTPWGSTVAHGSSVTAYSVSNAPVGSSCANLSEQRTCNNGTLSGSYSVPSCSNPCTSAQVSWGPSGICRGTATATTSGSSVTVTNSSSGVTGSATAICSNGSWSVSGGSCSANLPQPAGVSATDGTLAGRVNVTWSSVYGASGYDIQYRKQGQSSWTTGVTNTNATSWDFYTSDESVFEFQVRARNAAGTGDWSGSDTGYIRKQINPVFVSQNVPADVKTGASFSLTQVWKNNGVMTWTNSLNLGIVSGTSGFSGAIGKVTASTATDQNGTFNATLTAPTTPGTYALVMNWTYNGTTYLSSPAANVRVWGKPQCDQILPSKTFTYDPREKIRISIKGNSETQSVSLVKAWSTANGQDDVKTYTVNAGNNNSFFFDVDLSQHSGFGTYQVEITINNPVDTNTCTTTFELRQAQPITAVLNYLFGGNADKTKFVVPVSGGNTIRVLPTGTEALGLSVAITDENGNVLNQKDTQSNTAVDFGYMPWNDIAWAEKPITVSVSYKDPGAHYQVGAWTKQVMFVNPPRAKINVQTSENHPFVVSGQIVTEDGQAKTKAELGSWKVKVTQPENQILLADWQNADNSVSFRFDSIPYDAKVIDKTLQVTAQAIPPAELSLNAPIEIYKNFDPNILPPKTVMASDGTYEEQVVIEWTPPAENIDGFTYRVLRNDKVIFDGITGYTVSDRPPERGTVYHYAVLAKRTSGISIPQLDDGHMAGCIAPRIEDIAITNDSQNQLGVLIKYLPCVQNASIAYHFDNDQNTRTVEVLGASNSNYRYAYIDISSLGNGNHSIVFDVKANDLLGSPRNQSFSFVIDRDSRLPTSARILYNGAEAANGLQADTIGKFGILLEGGDAQFLKFE